MFNEDCEQYGPFEYAPSQDSWAHQGSRQGVSDCSTLEWSLHVPVQQNCLKCQICLLGWPTLWPRSCSGNVATSFSDPPLTATRLYMQSSLVWALKTAGRDGIPLQISTRWRESCQNVFFSNESQKPNKCKEVKRTKLKKDHGANKMAEEHAAQLHKLTVD